MKLVYMNDMDRMIIATLAYYRAFGWPLTLMELHERLIPASRTVGKIVEPSVSDVVRRLDIQVAIGTVICEHGLYALTGTHAGFGARRIEQEKVWAQKWRRMLRKAWWLQAVPYVRALCASGSLALGNMSPDSDWDIFVIARAGRLYTARLGLVVSAWLMRSLRTKRSQVVSDKFCFNHYLTTDGLAMRHRSLYVAHGAAIMVPIYDQRLYLQRLWQANQWIGDFRLPPTHVMYVRRSARRSRLLSAIRVCGELILDASIGIWIERAMRAWQKRRIARDPMTNEKNGRVVADDRELEFHPRSFEAIAVAQYRHTVDNL